MRLGIVADPLSSLKPQMDTTLLIAAEAHARGHEVLYADVHTLARTQDGASAVFQRLRYDGSLDTALETMADAPQRLMLDDLDVITMRQDPPVNERYTAITFILEGTATPVINDPVEVRSFNEKIAVMDLPGLSPASMTSESKEEIFAFWQRLEDGLILKPLNAFNGIGVMLLKPDAPEADIHKMIAEATEDGQQFTMAQAFVPAITKGDKRFFMIEGQSIGRMNRVPAEGQHLANIHAGAQPEQFDPTARDQEIIAGVAGLMEVYDIPMVCIDVIGEYLTEVNVTSPSGIPEINRIYGAGHEKPLVDLLERRATE